MKRVKIVGRSSKIRLALFALLAIATPAVAASRARPGRASRDFEQSSSTQPEFEALPLGRSPQNHLLVRAYINDKPALLGVDTGAPISAIAINRREYFGLTPIIGTSKIPARLRINGAFNSVAIAHTLQLGGLHLIDEPMVAIDFGGSSKARKLLNEQEIDGILGADILFPTEAVLDCQTQMLILKMDPKLSGRAPGLDFRGFTRMPIHVSSGYNLYVDGAVNGTPARWMIDTGAFTTLLHQRFARRMKIPLRDTPFTSAGVNLKQRGVQMATIRNLSVGSVDLHGKEVGVIDLEGLVHGGMLEGKRPVVGLLGSELLRRHHGIIDFGTKTLYLKE